MYKAAKHEAGARVSMYATACAPTGVPNEGLPALLLLITMYCSDGTSLVTVYFDVLTGFDPLFADIPPRGS